MALKKAARRRVTKAVEPSPVPEYKPTLTFRGEHAKKLLKTKIGQMVHAQVRGKITSMSMDRYSNGPDGKPEHRVEMEIHHTKLR